MFCSASPWVELCFSAPKPEPKPKPKPKAAAAPPPAALTTNPRLCAERQGLRSSLNFFSVFLISRRPKSLHASRSETFLRALAGSRPDFGAPPLYTGRLADMSRARIWPES